jgi:hypothetical protein
MLRNNIEVRLLIKGKPITEYNHNGNLFVEGRHGSSYEIEIINRNPTRSKPSSASTAFPSPMARRRALARPVI